MHSDAFSGCVLHAIKLNTIKNIEAGHWIIASKMSSELSLQIKNHPHMIFDAKNKKKITATKFSCATIKLCVI